MHIYKFSGNTCNSSRMSHTYKDLFFFDLLRSDPFVPPHCLFLLYCHSQFKFLCLLWNDWCESLLVHCWLRCCTKSLVFRKRLQHWQRVSNESCLQWLLSPLFLFWVGIQLYIVSIGFPCCTIFSVHIEVSSALFVCSTMMHEYVVLKQYLEWRSAQFKPLGPICCSLENSVNT